MKSIRINFVDFWPNFNYKDFYFYKILSEYYNVVISDKPDYLICSCFGYNHWKYKDCIKIYYTAENLAPDFNIYDYGIGFNYLDFGERYLRFPLWLIYSWGKLEEMETKILKPDSTLAKRKFCNFIYSNSGWADPRRERFYNELSKYKKIDSGGSFLNNIGFRVSDKLEFIKDYKFTIAFENSVVPGYTTEKIIEPMMANSMPIYYGDPLVAKDFNMKSCVHLRDYQTMEEAIEDIISIDSNETLYLEKLKEEWFSYKNVKQKFESSMKSFLLNIFEKDKKDAIQISNFGFQRRYRKEMSRTTPWANSLLVEKGYGLLDKLKK